MGGLIGWERRVEMKRGILSVVLIIVSVLAFAYHFSLVRFRYPVMVEGDPLKAPVKVVGISGNQITLEDGRVLALDISPQENISNELSQTDFIIEVEELNERNVVIFANRERYGYCGTPYTAPICIPIFRDRIPDRRREIIAIGKSKSD